MNIKLIRQAIRVLKGAFAEERLLWRIELEIPAISREQQLRKTSQDILGTAILLFTILVLTTLLILSPFFVKISLHPLVDWVVYGLLYALVVFTTLISAVGLYAGTTALVARFQIRSELKRDGI